MFTTLFTLIAVWFVAALISSMVVCVRHRKHWYDTCRYIARYGTLKQMKQLCKGNPTFAGYSRLNKAELSQFILTRI